MNCEALDLPLVGNVSGGKRLLSKKRKKGRWSKFWRHLVSLILIFLVPGVCVFSILSLDYVG